MFKRNVGIILLISIDIISILISLQGAILLRKFAMPYLIQFSEFQDKGILFYGWIIPVWLLFLIYEGLYSKKFSFWDEVKVLWKVSFFSTVAVFSILFLGKVGAKFSRAVIIIMGIISFPVLPVIRINAKKFLINLGLLKSKVLILGAGKTGRLLLNALKRDKNLGYVVVGFLDDDPQKVGEKIDGIKIHKGVDRAERYINRCEIQDVIIAMPGCERHRLITLINKLQHKAQNILLIPDLFGMAVLGTDLQHFFQEQVIGLEVKNNLAKPINILIKKSFDLIVSSALFIILSIPLLIITLLIKINSKGPAIFSQVRIGRNGRSFRCYKFRTMYNDADKRLDELLKNNPTARNEWEQYWKLKDDPRITKIGAFLRITSLDELPQIFNVFKGDMSLVGPRPVTEKEINEYYKESAKLCFGVPPGITGLWQVSGRSNTTYEQRIALDSWYVRNWNLWLDIVILLKTVRVVLKGEGAC